MRKLLLFPILVFFSANLLASNNPDRKRIYYAKRINPHPPVIDGKSDDAAWQKVEWSGDFLQREPYEGKPPSQQTAFKILYDDKNLYVVIRAFDTEADKIERRVTRRDGFDGDWVEINIDSYFDHRTAFSFTLTAAGVKGDAAISNDGNNRDSNWDPIWYGKASIDAGGWTAEMRIPFSQLRFAAKDEHVWGLQVRRRFFRKEERSVWQFIPQKTGGWVSYFGELRGIKGIKPPRRIELLPYSVGDLNRFRKEAGNPFADGQNARLSGGLDAKLGVTSDLTLDVTINPDFGQVEADPSIINLTAFETFFEEKRPFFIEGQNILDFRLMGGDGGFANDRLFYTRRIGRAPRYTPGLNAGEFLDMPENSSIATALKLTGKTSSGLSIGILDAVTDKESAVIDFNSQRRKETVEPLTNYFVGRVQKDFNKGNTSIGGMLTATHRNLAEDHLKFLNRSAYSGGFDFRHQWKDKTYYFDFRTAFSNIRGDAEAILSAQKSSARYFQRPDAGYVTLDPTRTSLSGHGGFVSFGKGGTSALRYSVGGIWRSPGLELNDLGFMRQADRIMQWSWVGYRITEPFSIFRRLNINFNQWAGWDFGGEPNFLGGNINGGGQLKNYWSIWGGFGREGNNLSNSALRGGPAMKFPGQWNQWYNVSTDRRKSMQFSFGGYNSWQDESDSRNHNIRFSASYRPSDAASIRISPFYNFRKSELQYLQQSDFEEQARYLFGTIDQKTLGITFRLNYSVTPNLSIQYYGQPFVSAGEYSEFKRITAPRDDTYRNRFQVFSGDEIRFDENSEVYEIDENLDGTVDYAIGQPNFNFRQFRSNLIVRWEYIPGSTVYLVWSQSRTGFTSDGNFSFRNDLDQLFDVYPNNVFLLKISRWFTL
jgi:hypothetical protein